MKLIPELKVAMTCKMVFNANHDAFEVWYNGYIVGELGMEQLRGTSEDEQRRVLNMWLNTITRKVS